MPKKLCASERRTIAQVMDLLPKAEATMSKVLMEVGPHCARLEPKARILEIGAAQGLYVNVLTKWGYDACGIEPWQPAIETSRELAERTGMKTSVIEGWAEDLPFEAEDFDFVFGISVMEHVRDPLKVFREVHRVLRPGGGFYFHTTTALARHQNEIQGFPLFPWYPQPVKRAIMRWAAQKHPHLVGGTATPAVNWFTPWGVRRDLQLAGFVNVVERWDLKRENQFDGWRREAFRLVRSRPALRPAAEFLKPGSGLVATK